MKKLWMMVFLSVSVLSVAYGQQGIRLPEQPNRSRYVDYRDCDRGFWCAVELEGGSSVFLDKTNLQAAALTYTGGYRFSEYLRVGVGFGGRYYFNNNSARRRDDSRFTLPLFADVRGNIISQASRDIVPYWNLKVGGIVWDGFFVSPTVGLRFGEQRNAWLLGLSYSFNTIRSYPGQGRETNFMLLRLGYEF